jgi:hypothetical protein
MNERLLRPRLCPVFNEDVLYLFYGGPFYRRTFSPTEDTAELPIAFVFHPSVLQRVKRYYPFDTGAAASGRFGASATRSLGDFKNRFPVLGSNDATVPRKLVQYLYGSNGRYLRGMPEVEAANRPQPFPDLHAFLSANLTPDGVDHRQCTIECHYLEPLPLDMTLLAVALPEMMTDVLATYCETTNHVPELLLYPSHRIFRPGEVVAQIQEQARLVIDRFVEIPKARP